MARNAEDGPMVFGESRARPSVAQTCLRALLGRRNDGCVVHSLPAGAHIDPIPRVVALGRCGVVGRDNRRTPLGPLIFYLLAINHLLPDVSQGGPSLETDPMAYIRRSQGDGYILMMFGAVFPGIVALIGGGLALACAAGHAAWRVLLRREPHDAP